MCTRVQSNQFEGDDALRALSQTCRTFRDIFLPVLWARVHVTFNLRTRSNGRTRAKMLERRMKGILKRPSVVPYIQSVSFFATANHSLIEPLQITLDHVRGMQVTGNLWLISSEFWICCRLSAVSQSSKFPRGEGRRVAREKSIL